MSKINKVIGNITVLKRMTKKIYTEEKIMFERKQQKLDEINEQIVLLQKNLSDFLRYKG